MSGTWPSHGRRVAVLAGVLLLLLLSDRSRPVAAQDEPPARSFSTGAHLQLKRLSTADGLVFPAVESILQDRHGFMWFATLGGINRYDGYRMTAFAHDPADPNSSQAVLSVALAEDTTGRIWIANLGGGLAAYDPRTDQFTHYRRDPLKADSLSGNEPRSISVDRSGALWVGTWGAGLNRLDPASGAFTHFRHDAADPASLSSDLVAAIHHDRVGRLWVGTTGGGLNLLDPATGAFISWQNDPADSSSLPHNNITELVEDRSGLLWIATEGAGVAHFDLYAGPFDLFTGRSDEPDALSNGLVRGVTVDHDGAAWVGTFGGGLNRFDRATGRFAHYRHDAADPGSLSDDLVWTVYVDRANVVWVGTEGGYLNRLDRATGHFTRYQLAQANGAGAPIHTIYEDRAGVLWIGSDGQGLTRFDPASGTFTAYRHDAADPASLGADFVKSIYEDRAGTLWVGTWGGGLNRFDPASGTFTAYRHNPANPASLSFDWVSSILETGDGTLWVGTAGGGLSRFDRARETFQHLTSRDGLPSNIVLGILETDGQLWLTSPLGLTQFDVQAGTLRSFDASDSLPAEGFTVGSLARAGDGEVYAGGYGGLVAFDPAGVQDSTYTTPVVFTDIAINDQPVAIGAHTPLQQAINETTALVLPPTSREIAIEVAALDYRAPNRLRYRYQLQGVDRAWHEVDSRQRFINYRNLGAGTYVLQVTATNHGGRWNEASRALTITITPYWWERRWVRGAMVLLASAGLVGGYRWRLARLRAHQRHLEQLVAERTDQLEHANDQLEHTNDQLAIEIVEHEQTEAEARQSRDELATLLTISQSIVSMLDLEPLLDRVLEQLGRIIAYDAAFVATVDGQTLTIRAYRSRAPRGPRRGIQLDMTRIQPLRDLVATREPFVIADLQTDTAMVDYIAGAIGERVPDRSWMGVPLIVQDRVIGVMNMLHAEAGCFSAADLERVQAFANQVALALENARLYERAREAATLEERNRLARDLHDAVTQTLFSASLVAEALPKTWHAAPPLAVRGVEHVRLLTRGALAEMRTLLVELRPAALTEKPLSELLQALCMATSSRSQVPVECDLNATSVLPPEVQIALYRIAQEALNNVVKHADASRVRITLMCREAAIVLAVADDGHGFERATVAPDSFGLGIMRERADAIGARLRIWSRAGHGTIIAVRWRPPGDRVTTPVP